MTMAVRRAVLPERAATRAGAQSCRSERGQPWFPRVCVIMIARQNRARPTLASPTRRCQHGASFRRLWPAGGRCLIGLISQYVTEHLVFKDFTKKKRSQNLLTGNWYRKNMRLSGESRRGVLRARKRQVRCTRDAAPFRDARRDTPRAPETANAHEARLGFGFLTFTCDARARATDVRAAPRRNRARGSGGRELLAKPTKHARDGGRRGVGHVQGELPAPEEGARGEDSHGGVCYAAG